uniref:Uncharacterized protein n=1 Tax=Picea glauca TaxID=3330 RepID=A0A101M3F4_PICGL|nr:hypothetical protein ABT39_MTgene179 [Picea glauca]
MTSCVASSSLFLLLSKESERNLSYRYEHQLYALRRGRCAGSIWLGSFC